MISDMISDIISKIDKKRRPESQTGNRSFFKEDSIRDYQDTSH